MFKDIEPAYFGLEDADDADDAELLREEAALEATLRAAAIDEWDRAESERQAQVAALVRAVMISWRTGRECDGRVCDCEQQGVKIQS